MSMVSFSAAYRSISFDAALLLVSCARFCPAPA
jgi:hypothetical protein